MNELNEDQLERIAMLMEEAGEIVQICGKIIRHGYTSVDPTAEEPRENVALLEDEIEDLSSIALLMNKAGDIHTSTAHVDLAVILNKKAKYIHSQESLGIIAWGV